MTLDDIISFVSKNQGRKLSTYGEHKKFTVELGKSKAFVFITEKGTRLPETYKMIENGLSVFNKTPSINTAEYLNATKTRRASYVLGFFRQIDEDQKHEANIDNTLTEDISSILSSKSVDSTTKQRLVDARVGQGEFRSSVLRLWNDRCSVTKSCMREAIRASHIKPWRDST